MSHYHDNYHNSDGETTQFAHISQSGIVGIGECGRISTSMTSIFFIILFMIDVLLTQTTKSWGDYFPRKSVS